MEGYVIITNKEDLIHIVKEVFEQIELSKQETINCPKYMDINKLIEFLRQNNCEISKSHIYKLTRSKNIPHRKFGKKLLFSKKDIIVWLNKHNK